MGALSPRVTKQRVVGGLTFLIVATGIMYMLGADMAIGTPLVLLGAGILLYDVIAAL